jgi:ribosomal-protein-alanine N-acetyltransferase
MRTIDQPELESKRLLIRSFDNGDAPRVQLLAGDQRVSRYTLNVPWPYLDGMAEAWIDTHREAWVNEEQATFAVVRKTGVQLVGAVSLVAIDKGQAEIGYWIGHPYWDKGYCTEAAALLLHYGLGQLQLDRITARHLAANPASGKVLNKLGMTHLGSRPSLDRQSKTSMFEHYENSGP